MFSGLGIVACMGIVVNNNIILIDSYRKELSKNDNNIYDAILIACKNRIRPIFLTTITTITGLLPSALQISLDIFDRTIAYKSEETYFFVLLAWSLIWGIGFAIKSRKQPKKVGSLLAKHKIKLIYGGGNMGLMGILANSALDNGGDVYGVITEHLIDIEKKIKVLIILKLLKLCMKEK